MSLILDTPIDELKKSLVDKDEAKILSILEALEPTTKQAILHALQIELSLLSVLHSDENIQNKSREILGEMSVDFQTVEQGFAIFKSIVEYYPWMGDYKDLQRQNFEQFRTIKDHYEACLVQSPVFVELYLDLGRKLYMLFDLIDEAQLCFESIISYDQKNDEAYYALGRIFERKHQYDRALAHYERCIVENPENMYGLLQIGAIKVSVFQKYNEAIYHYNKAVEIDPYAAEVYVRIAEAYYAQEDIPRTKQFIEIALGINEFHEEALNLLGTVQWKSEKNFEKAIETYEKGLDHLMHGDSGLLLGSLGELYAVYLSDQEKAKLYYEKALKAKPQQPKRVRQLVALLNEFYQDYGAIEECFENYLRVEKNDASMYAEYAEFLVTYMHNYEFANEQVELALALDAEQDLALRIKHQIADYLTPEEEIDTDTDEDWDDDDDDDDDFVGGGAADSDTGPVSDS
ncbi:MAG: tetratricopeptide repeat protein [Aureispira sp.]|nr:tetratricopeptide repeat protein [Aureispira sp.]